MAVLVAWRIAFAAQVLLSSLLLISPLLMMSTVRVSAQEVMTNETVVQMVRAGLSESVILAKIRSSQTQFDTRTEALIALKKTGVSEKVLAAIVGGDAPSAPAAAPPAAAASPRGVAMVPLAGQAARRGPVFHVSAGKQVEMIAAGGEIERSRTPFNRKTELVLSGNKAKYRTAERQPVFLSSAEPAEIPLVRLQPGSNDRNLKFSSSSRTPYAGSTSQRGIRSEDRIDVEAERDQSGFFRIRPRAPLAPGEYGFVLTRSSGTIPSGTVYDFGVD